jgi:hypothetical protein
VAPSCCIGGQGRVMQRCARRTCIHAYTGCVPACVYVNQYMCICMRTSLDMYTLCTHVWVYTHTHVHIHTHKHVLKTQTLNSGTQEFRRQKKKNHVTIVYTYIQIHKYSQYIKNIDPYMKVFKIQTLNSPDANSRGNNPESIMQLHMYVHAQMYVFVHRQVCIHIYINMHICACICMHVVNRYISLNPVHAKPRRILPWSLNPKHSAYTQCPHP